MRVKTFPVNTTTVLFAKITCLVQNPDLAQTPDQHHEASFVPSAVVKSSAYIFNRIHEYPLRGLLVCECSTHGFRILLSNTLQALPQVPLCAAGLQNHLFRTAQSRHLEGTSAKPTASHLLMSLCLIRPESVQKKAHIPTGSR